MRKLDNFEKLDIALKVMIACLVISMLATLMHVGFA